MRDYSQPHPQAIFRDKPTHFIEVYVGNNEDVCVNLVNLSIESLNISLECTKKYTTLTTIALFLIKPKTNKTTLHKAEYVDLSNAKFIQP